MSTAEQSLSRLNRLNNDYTIQNFIAQASSRYILLNTNESRDNFPAYSIQDDQLNILAFYYLEIACSLAENNDFESARDGLERGASILEYVNGAAVSDGALNRYYTLIASLAYYVAFQYSKSFILINKIQEDTLVAQMVAKFLRRDFIALKNQVAQLMVDPSYDDENLAFEKDEVIGNRKVYERVIGSCLAGFINYFQTGQTSFMEEARERLQLLKEIAEVNQEPSIWWVIRLLLLICEGFEISALWKVLPQYFATTRSLLTDYIYSLTFRQPKGIYELFITQRKCLDQVLRSERGCVVSIPTSSGKTRIAELAILDSLAKHAGKKVLYVAPFRSLAFEIEHTLQPVMEHLGKQLSHMYGGALFSDLDEMIFEESDLIIATPEKAKAILRGKSELASEIQLVIFDEGHLFGANERLIANEIFFEE
ncbi:MAG: DEAD/DEAH box helicase, partial [Flavisolibacter sp.]|nr:DEAD/DEAH box helicase [Flavisolibacter sp.]